MLNRGISLTSLSLTMWDIFNYVLERGIDKMIYALIAKILQESCCKFGFYELQTTYNADFNLFGFLKSYSVCNISQTSRRNRVWKKTFANGSRG